MSIEMAEPSAELAHRLLGEVPWSERLVGVNMHCLSGPTRMDLYSLDQAAAFMRSDELEHLMDPMSGASYGYIDPDVLVGWVKGALRDAELADAVKAVAGEYEHYLGQLEPIQDLLVQRLRQAEAVAGAAVH